MTQSQPPVRVMSAPASTTGVRVSEISSAVTKELSVEPEIQPTSSRRVIRMAQRPSGTPHGADIYIPPLLVTASNRSGPQPGAPYPRLRAHRFLLGRSHRSATCRAFR